MLKKIIFAITFCLTSVFGFAQKNINNYKYIIVPKQFSFSNAEDQYQLNSLTKFLFNKYGYQAYKVGDAFPEELNTNRCMALTTEVLKEKGTMFKTKLKINLKDCNGQLVMSSDIGETRVKDYKKAYNIALREAFKTYQFLNYKYEPNPSKKELPTEKAAPKPPIKPTINFKKDANAKEETKAVSNNLLHYAQKTIHGFQLVDATPKVVMVLLNTGATNVYIVKDKSAIVFKENGFWYYSENNNGLKENTKLNIKF